MLPERWSRSLDNAPSLAVSIFEATQCLPNVFTSGEKQGEADKETPQEITVLPVTHHLHQSLTKCHLSPLQSSHCCLQYSPIPILVPCPLTASA